MRCVVHEELTHEEQDRRTYTAAYGNTEENAKYNLARCRRS